jgi:hypothetical protein
MAAVLDMYLARMAASEVIERRDTRWVKKKFRSEEVLMKPGSPWVKRLI